MAVILNIRPCTDATVLPVLTLETLKHLGACALEQLFAEGEAVPLPEGFARGRILVLCGYRFPQMSARLAGLAWKGKHFAEDGAFINQWVGFRALQSQAVLGPSWFDDRPCVVLEYPPGTPLFCQHAR